MEKMYFSVDIEASGSTPGKYSMLSLGACVVNNTNNTFYRELKPLNNNYNIEAMKVGCLGLYCLNRLKEVNKFNPKSEKFDPGLVLQLLKASGEEPKKVMCDFADWIKNSSKGYTPVIIAAPILFDGMFINYYFDNFYDKENPFGHSGEDMNSIYRGYKLDVNANMKDLNFKDERKILHNALEDAVQQAKWFEKILELMKKDKRKL